MDEQEFQEKLKGHGEAEQSWLPCCPLPTPLARTSPFFPTAHQKLKDRTYIEEESQ
jgi:hypothetical protein